MNSYGMGGIFKPANSSRFWIRYSVRGKQYRESSKSTSETKARALLKRRLGEIEAGKHSPKAGKVTIRELLDALVDFYRVNQHRSTNALLAACKHLCAAWGDDFPAIAIGTPKLRQYVLDRQAEGAANATIRRELAHLRKAYNLALQDGRLNQRPHIPGVFVDNARRGFLEPGDFARLRDILPADLRDFIHFLYLSGWRCGEARTLAWTQVDLQAHEIKLDPRHSKTGKGRTLPCSVSCSKLSNARISHGHWASLRYFSAPEGRLVGSRLRGRPQLRRRDSPVFTSTTYGGQPSETSFGPVFRNIRRWLGVGMRPDRFSTGTM